MTQDSVNYVIWTLDGSQDTLRYLFDFFSLSSRKPTNFLDLEHNDSITGCSSRL